MDPHDYDRWFDRPWGHYAFGVELAAVLWALGPLARRHVLDVGCGTGRFTSALEARGGLLTGIDLDPGMIAMAANRVKGPLVVGDALELPFAGESFDSTMAVTLCEYSAAPSRVISEMARVTRPDGHVVVGVLNPRSPWGAAQPLRFRHPPWDTARFVTRRALVALGRPYGDTRIGGFLFAPGVPLPRSLGQRAEFLGTRLVPARGAFQVLVMTKGGQ